MASSKRSNKLEVHKYWHEFPPTKHRFFKVLLVDFEQQLRIPRKFMECFRGKISRRCSLVGPSSNVWSVKIRRSPDDTLFSDGWERFVSDHGLQATDFLVFTYSGDSSFDVSIFNYTGCEVEASYYAENMQSNSKQKEKQSPSPGTEEYDLFGDEEEEISCQDYQEWQNSIWFKRSRQEDSRELASSKRSNKLELHKYWHEFPPTKHRFFKVLISDFEQQLRIPSKFMEGFRGKISGWCTLTGPSSNAWSVKIVRNPDDTLFSDGWDRFVSDHGLQATDFLVFTYSGNSSFDVSIFNNTGCEVEASYFAKKFMSNIKQREEQSLSPAVEEYDLFGDEAEESTCREYQERKKSHSFEMGREEDSRAKQHQMFYISTRRYVTQQEKQRAYNLAIDHLTMKKPTGVPMFQITMLPSVYRDFSLTIPKQWALEHMCRESHDIELKVPEAEKSWIVGCRWTSQCKLSARWSTFVLENNLEEHDVCVFELIQKWKPRSTTYPVLNVHIFRVVAEPVP